MCERSRRSVTASAETVGWSVRRSAKRSRPDGSSEKVVVGGGILIGTTFLPKTGERESKRINSQTSKPRIPLLPHRPILVARFLVARTRGRTIPWWSTSWRTSRTGTHLLEAPTAPLQTPTRQQRRWHDDG